MCSMMGMWSPGRALLARGTFSCPRLTLITGLSLLGATHPSALLTLHSSGCRALASTSSELQPEQSLLRDPRKGSAAPKRLLLVAWKQPCTSWINFLSREQPWKPSPTSP